MEVSIKLVQVADNRPFIVSIERDITVRKQVEAALRESEERYRTVVENTDDFVWQINIDGATVLAHDLFTNGILYLDIGLDLHGLNQDDIPYASLLGSILLEMGI